MEQFLPPPGCIKNLPMRGDGGSQFFPYWLTGEPLRGEITFNNEYHFIVNKLPGIDLFRNYNPPHVTLPLSTKIISECALIRFYPFSQFHRRFLTYSRNSSHDFTEFKFVEDCSLSGRIQPNHQDPHLLLAKQTLEQAREHVSHDEEVWQRPESN